MSSEEIYQMLEERDENFEIPDESSGSEDEKIEMDDCDTASEFDISDAEGETSEPIPEKESDEMYYIKRIRNRVADKKGTKSTKVEIVQEFKWAKKPLVSKFAKTSKKNVLVKRFPAPKDKNFPNCVSAFLKIVDINMLDNIVIFTNLYMYI